MVAWNGSSSDEMEEMAHFSRSESEEEREEHISLYSLTNEEQLNVDKVLRRIAQFKDDSALADSVANKFAFEMIGALPTEANRSQSERYLKHVLNDERRLESYARNNWHLIDPIDHHLPTGKTFYSVPIRKTLEQMLSKSSLLH